MSDFSIRGNNAAAVLGTQGKQAYASIITETHLRHGRLSLSPHRIFATHTFVVP